MINGDSTLWLDNTIKHDLLITDGSVSVSDKNYSVSDATITITNDILESQAFTLRQSLCSQSQIQFGSCESANVSFTIHENIPTIKNKILKVYIIPDHDASKMLQLGVFKVYEDKLTADRTRRNITAYDALYEVINSDVAAWYNTTLPDSSSSMTLAQFRAAFLSHFSITAESATLVNDSITITRTIEPEQLSGADVIKAICEINGCFGKITNEGKFKFVELATDIDRGLFPAEDLYPADDLYPEDIDPNTGFITQSIYTDIQFEDYQSAAITQLTIRTDDEDVGVTVGTSGNRYVITGNFLVFGYNATALTSAATNALTKMSNRPYTPCTVNAMGNPVLETGDPIRVNTKYRGFLSYILERKLSGIQALRDTYTVQGKQYSNENLNSVSTQYKQLSSKVLRIKQDVDGVATELTDQLDDTVVGSYAYQTAQEIGSKVSSTDYNGNEIASRINQTSTTVTIEASKVQLSSYVTKTGMVSDLDDEIGSSITISPNCIEFGSSGTLLVNTSNFTLDSNGNATFSGNLNGATLSSNGSILATDTGSSYASVMSAGGFATGTLVSGGIDPNNRISVDDKIKIRALDAFGQHETYLDAERIETKDIHVTGQIDINNSLVLTRSDIDPSTVLTTSSSIPTSQLSGTISSNSVDFQNMIFVTYPGGMTALNLMNITINGTTYKMYAYQVP